MNQFSATTALAIAVVALSALVYALANALLRLLQPTPPHDTEPKVLPRPDFAPKAKTA